jgi:hypothetical protein
MAVVGSSHGKSGRCSFFGETALIPTKQFGVESSGLGLSSQLLVHVAGTDVGWPERAVCKSPGVCTLGGGTVRSLHEIYHHEKAWCSRCVCGGVFLQWTYGLLY